MIILLGKLSNEMGFEALSMKDRLKTFRDFWLKTLHNLAEKKSKVALVDFLSDPYPKPDTTKKPNPNLKPKPWQTFNAINSLYDQSRGPQPTSEIKKKLQNLFTNFQLQNYIKIIWIYFLEHLHQMIKIGIKILKNYLNYMKN